MKKIIWFFGESATGKLTLINNLYNKDAETLNTFNMNNKKIMVSDITLEDRKRTYPNIEDDNYDDSLMEEDNLYFSKERALKRRRCIMYDTINFINSDNDILLIKGQINDLNIKRGNIIGNYLNKYYEFDDLEIEVFILQVSDKEELIKRIQTKTWFKKMNDEKEKEGLLNKIPLKIDEHRKEVINAFSDYNIPIYVIESSNNSYRKEGVINGKSSYTRR